MKAVLTVEVIAGDKRVQQNQLYDTTKAKKVCDVVNSFNVKVEEIYITNKGTLFIKEITGKEKLKLPGTQENLKNWIGQNEPDKYIKFFGEVEEG